MAAACLCEVTAKQIGALAKMMDTARRLQTMPGVGPISALAVEAFAPPLESFPRGEILRPGWAWYRGSIRREGKSGSDEYQRPDKPI